MATMGCDCLKAFHLAKLVVFGQMGYFCPMSCISPNGLYLAKKVVFGHNRFFLSQMVLFSPNGCIWLKLVVFGQMVSIFPQWLCLAKKALY